MDLDSPHFLPRKRPECPGKSCRLIARPSRGDSGRFPGHTGSPSEPCASVRSSTTFRRFASRPSPWTFRRARQAWKKTMPYAIWKFERRLLIHFYIPEGSLSSHLDDSCSLVNPGTLELVLAVHRCDAIGLKVLVGAAFFWKGRKKGLFYFLRFSANVILHRGKIWNLVNTFFERQNGWQLSHPPFSLSKVWMQNEAAAGNTFCFPFFSCVEKKRKMQMYSLKIIYSPDAVMLFSSSLSDRTFGGLP